MIRQGFRTAGTTSAGLRAEPQLTAAPPQGADGETTAWSKTKSTLESTIGKYPGAAFGAALLAGIALGWWIKRR